MNFDPPLIPATLLRRYKRFLADVELADGHRTTVHTPNTGAMTGCAIPGSRVWLRDTGNPARKYPLAWELATGAGGDLIGVNTHLANALLGEALDAGRIPQLQGYTRHQAEVRYGEENSRIDWLLTHPLRPACYVEVKSVTLLQDDGVAAFPDTVSARGSKHLRELAVLARQGQRAVLFFCVQHSGASGVRAAASIDPVYARTLIEARNAGVEVLAWRVAATPESLALQQRVPFLEDGM